LPSESLPLPVTARQASRYICSCPCSKYKELVDKVHAALKTAIKEAQTDTAHGKGRCHEQYLLDGSLESCMHLVDQLLVLDAGNKSSI
jgi:hypothetical protein